MPLARCALAFAVTFVVLPGCVMPQFGRQPEVGGTEPDEVGRQLDELIRRTNEIESYVAEYEVIGPEEGSFRLVFQRPDQAKFEFSGPEEGLRSLCYVGSRVGVTLGSGRSTESYCFDLEGMSQHFEAVDQALAGFGVEIGDRTRAWRLHMDPPSGPNDGIRFHVVAAQDGSPVLAWLSNLPGASPHWTREGGDLTFSDKGFSVSVSEQTGFLTSMTWKGSSIRLRDLALDEPVTTEFDLPAPVSGLGSREIRNLGRSLAAEFFQARRRAIVELELDHREGESSRIRAAWRDLYMGLCDLEFGDWVVAQREAAERTRDWAASQALTVDEVREHEAQRNEAFESELGDIRAILHSWITPDHHFPAEFLADAELQELELVIADAALESCVVEPVREAYRSTIASMDRR